MLRKLEEFLQKVSDCYYLCKYPRIFSTRLCKKRGIPVSSILFFTFIIVGQVSAGLENSKECEQPCPKKNQESISKKKSVDSKKSSLQPKIQQEIPTDIKALKESIKARMIYGQSSKGKLDQIKSITSQEIENQGLRETKTISENHFKPMHSDAIRPTPKEESFQLKDINENLKWKQK